MLKMQKPILVEIHPEAVLYGPPELPYLNLSQDSMPQSDTLCHLVQKALLDSEPKGNEIKWELSQLIN